MSDLISCCWKGQCCFLLSLPSLCWGFAAAPESSISLSLWGSSSGCAGSACPLTAACWWLMQLDPAKGRQGVVGWNLNSVGLWPSVVFPSKNSASCSWAFHEHSGFQKLCFVSFWFRLSAVLEEGCLLCYHCRSGSVPASAVWFLRLI